MCMWVCMQRIRRICKLGILACAVRLHNEVLVLEMRAICLSVCLSLSAVLHYSVAAVLCKVSLKPSSAAKHLVNKCVY